LVSIMNTSSSARLGVGTAYVPLRRCQRASGKRSVFCSAARATRSRRWRPGRCRRRSRGCCVAVRVWAGGVRSEWAGGVQWACVCGRVGCAVSGWVGCSGRACVGGWGAVSGWVGFSGRAWAGGEQWPCAWAGGVQCVWSIARTRCVGVMQPAHNSARHASHMPHTGQRDPTTSTRAPLRRRSPTHPSTAYHGTPASWCASYTLTNVFWIW
jgi:hypothetical protein